MRHTYFSRLFLSFLGLTFLFVVILLMTAFYFFSSWIDQYTEKHLRQLAELGASSIWDAIDIAEIRSIATREPSLADTLATTTASEATVPHEPNIPPPTSTLTKLSYPSYFQSRINLLGQQMETRVTLIASDGTVVADSDYDPRTLANHGDREEVRHALKGENFIEERWSTTQNQRILYIAVPIPKHHSHVSPDTAASSKLSPMIPFVLRIAVPMGQIELELHQRNMGIFLVSLPIWLGTLLVGAWLLSRYFARPMRRLAEDMQAIAHGNLDVRLRADHSVEFQEVDESVHSLTEEVRKSYRSLEEQRHTLENILNAIREPILVMDSQTNISFANSEFHRLFCSWRDDHTIHQDAQRILSHPDFDKLLQSSDARKNSHADADSTETIFDWDGKTILARVGIIPQSLLRVCTFSDVTQVIELANIKRDLVNSVSHELRTPLAAIQGFVEMLQDDEQNESHRHYLEIIHRHCLRLSRLIDDLLTLGEIENKSYKLEYTKVHLSSIVEEIQILLESRFREKSLAFESAIPFDLTFDADPFRMEQMLLNLLDNAAKYTTSGTIGVRAKQEGSWIQIEVHDTGIGMTEKDCQRIFDRFYVADKSRSRRLGGTGLGLSIVKHIVLLHHGQIIVKSQVGIGTIFRILLPVTVAETIPQESLH